jgi:hypothetical protein
MDEKLDELLAVYREQWIELNVVNDLREKLDARGREIHAQQRQLANKIAALHAELLESEGARTSSGSCKAGSQQ